MVKFLDKGYPVRSMPGAVAERNVLASGVHTGIFSESMQVVNIET